MAGSEGRRRRRRFFLPEISGEATHEELVDAGMIIALAGVRMAVKNRIIVHTLRDRADYDEAWHVAVVRDEMLALASEKAEDARRISAARSAASHRQGLALHQSDYRRGDTVALGRRVAALRELSRRLEEAAESGDGAVRVVRAAQESALEEITASLSTASIPESSLSSESPTHPDSAEQIQRQKELLRRDLDALVRANSDGQPARSTDSGPDRVPGPES